MGAAFCKIYGKITQQVKPQSSGRSATGTEIMILKGIEKSFMILTFA